MNAAVARLADAQRVGRASPMLREALRALQQWQAARLAADYADQAALPLRVAAVRFFLDDLYGPQDFATRDAQFSRALRHLRRMLPVPALAALTDALELQALTQELDGLLAQRLAREPAPIDPARYAAAYRAVDRAADRRRQIDLVVAIGRRLERAVHWPGIELALRLAAAPARIAGYGDLQSFIERGFEAFRALGPEAGAFIETIEARERAFKARVLDEPPAP